MGVYITEVLVVALLAFGVAFTFAWLIVGGDDEASSHERRERERALRERIDELQALLKVPPLFWEVWERYTHEHARLLLEEFPNTGKHSSIQDEPSNDSDQQPGERG